MSCFLIEELRVNKKILLERKCCKFMCMRREVMICYYFFFVIYLLEVVSGKRKKLFNIIMIKWISSKVRIVGCKEIWVDFISIWLLLFFLY